MAYGKPPAVQECDKSGHPSRPHGHYGPGYWCSDLSSPLLSSDNGGHVERGWILIYEKRALGGVGEKANQE